MSQEDPKEKIDQALSELNLAVMLAGEAGNIADDIYRNLSDEDQMRDKQLVISAVADKIGRLINSAYGVIEDLLQEKGLV